MFLENMQLGNVLHDLSGMELCKSLKSPNTEASSALILRSTTAELTVRRISFLCRSLCANRPWQLKYLIPILPIAKTNLNNFFKYDSKYFRN